MCLTAKDRQKLTKAGYICLRTTERTRTHKKITLSGEESIVISAFIISQSTNENSNWHDRNVFDTKAERQRHLDHLLRDPKVIMDE